MKLIIKELRFEWNAPKPYVLLIIAVTIIVLAIAYMAIRCHDGGVVSDPQDLSNIKKLLNFLLRSVFRNFPDMYR